MKNLFKMTLVLVAAALALTSCDCFKKMAKDPSAIKVTCTPDVLVLNNGKVVADVTAEVPAKYFNKKASLKVTPALVYEGGVTKGNTLLLQGEKVADNGMIVKTKETLSIKRHIEFAYKPEMQLSNLVLIVEVKCKSGKCKEFTLINANTGEILPADTKLTPAEYGLTIAKGINTLQGDLDFSEAMLAAANNYKRVTTVVTKADIVYKINSSRVAKRLLRLRI